MATLPTLKRTALRIEKMALELIDKRELKASQRSHRWQRSKTGKEFDLDTRLIMQLFEAVQHFNESIIQPIGEEEE